MHQFALLEDTEQPEQHKRWVVVVPPGGRGATLLLARAAMPEQERFVGDQAGGRVFLFLRTDDFWRDFHAIRERGVRFVREPKRAEYGTVAVFEDLYGNRWDLGVRLGVLTRHFYKAPRGERLARRRRPGDRRALRRHLRLHAWCEQLPDGLPDAEADARYAEKLAAYAVANGYEIAYDGLSV